jgi:TPP-dependent pyruvate/acetoin dehydrogenase alpha subunit
MVANDQYEKLYRQALLIRRVEEKIIDIYPSDNIQSPVHLSIGQEAVSVGLCAALEPGDIIYGSYRSHALYIACGGDLTQMFAELMGRLGGISKGKAGSMHLSFPEQGLMGASAVVASHVPHAVGSALAARYRRTGQIVACVFGDGALEEGVSHECFNFAALKSLPILFLCENNGLAVHSHRRDRQAFAIEGLATLYGLPYRKVDEGWDFLKVWDACLDAGRSLRAGGGPRFLEVTTFRSREHVGIGYDFDAGYRSRADYDRWQERDPLVQDVALAKKLLPGIDVEIEAAVAAAFKSPVPGVEHLLTDVA